MKEIRILIQQLRSYPNNWFVYPVDNAISIDGIPYEPGKDGLVVCDMQGETKAFIETGVCDGKVVID